MTTHTPTTLLEPNTPAWGGLQHALNNGEAQNVQPCGCYIHVGGGRQASIFCPLHAAAPALLAALENIVMYHDTGRTETRWTDKDGIAEAGSLANVDAARAALRQARG